MSMTVLKNSITVEDAITCLCQPLKAIYTHLTQGKEAKASLTLNDTILIQVHGFDVHLPYITPDDLVSISMKTEKIYISFIMDIRTGNIISSQHNSPFPSKPKLAWPEKGHTPQEIINCWPKGKYQTTRAFFKLMFGL